MLRAVAVVLATGERLIGTSSDYESVIAEWRKNYDIDLRSEKGPLYLIARVSSGEGRSEIGSDPSSRITLPDRT